MKLKGRATLKVFDLHSDLFTDIAMRKSRGEKNVFDRIHYPKLKKAGITAVLCVFWVEPAYLGQAYKRFLQLYQLVLNDLADSRHVAIIHPGSPQTYSDQIQIYLGLEGLTFLEGWEGETEYLKVENAFDDLAENNIMHCLFAWNERNFLATGTGVSNPGEKEGLSHCGKFAVKKANQQKWLLDASHLNEAGFWDMYHASTLPIMASHSNAKSLCGHERNLSDKQIKAIAEKGGIIGLNAYGGFVSEQNPTIDHFIDHAVYIASLVGTKHLAFGFDFLDYLQSYNSGAAFSIQTKGLEDVTKVPDLLEKMSRRGFSATEIEAISFYNADSYIKNYMK